jgi:hypothetical protein
LIGRWEPSSDLSFFTTSRSTPHPLRVLAGLSPRQARPQCYLVGILHWPGGSIEPVAILYPVLTKNLSLGARHL